jgi:hypothetical protein
VAGQAGRRGRRFGVFWRLYVAFWNLQYAVAFIERDGNIPEDLPEDAQYSDWKPHRNDDNPARQALTRSCRLLGGLDVLTSMRDWDRDAVRLRRGLAE